MTKQASADLSAIGATLASGAIGFPRFVEEAMEALTRIAECDRAGVWCVSGEAPDRVLHCVRIYDRLLGRPTRVEDMREPQITLYVDAVAAAGTLDAVDVRTHPATRDFFDAGGLHSGIAALMAKTSLLNGELLCVLTCARFEGGPAFGPRQLSALRKFSSEFVLTVARNCHPPRALLCGLPPPDDWDKAC